MTDPDLPTNTEGEGETLDMPAGERAFVPGQILGERYEIIEMLGRGGMGEVWQAFDLKLRVEVALKALRPDFFKSADRRDLLRQEVRAAREVVSPNVCRIFDLIEIEGRELVSMEYVDGAMLLGVLQERGPLELKEAQDIASQFLAGLEAIHKVGLVHRDIKPENIMLTRAGRVVVMDFGLARQEDEGGGSVSGTPAYMSPEQSAGEILDSRADVYSAGVVLAEMVCPEGIKNIQSRQSVWDGVRSEPAKVPDTPWADVIKRAVAKDRERRFNTAHTLTRALEDVTLRVEGADDLNPYPGLASFTEDDAEYFFGREAEVEQMWRRLEGPPRMLALVGPSGAGKSSFLRAGLIPGSTAQWSSVVSSPGTNPELSLSRALGAEISGDSEAVDLLLQFDDPGVAVEVVSSWRQKFGHAVLIVDQFEELFTQNAPDVQRRFTQLLNRFVLEADVHVLLSMRDDFLFRCHDQESLKPIFSELTPIGPPVGGALRRALVQPATKCGFRFEDDELVDEMLAEVEGERGALPLLAFAAARLWEMRDRETGLLTRQAYHDIGGVGGALARHAEATVDQIGHERIPIVRELFRNLVTAEGTRAVREWDELLSVFGDSSDESQAAVLRSLIDARLLTSYEVREEDREPTRRVEIIHESLLANWPRLVRWQTQDADAAQLRDQLRQAARTWDEHDRTTDYLWSGRAFREFAVWREGYSGGLSKLEEKFAAAMTAHAKRRARLRKVVTAAVILALLGVIAVVGVSRQQAVAEAARAEASRMVALGQLEIEGNPTAAFAWARASLGVADTDGGRDLAVKALATGSVARVLQPDQDAEGVVHRTKFSPDGQWASLHGYTKLKFVRSSGGPFAFIDDFPAFESGSVRGEFSRDSTSFVACKIIGEDARSLVRHYDLPAFGTTANLEIPPAMPNNGRWLVATRQGVLVVDKEEESYLVRRVELDGTFTPIAHLAGSIGWFEAGRDGSWMVERVGRDVFLQPLDDPDQPKQQIHRFDRDVGWFKVHERFDWIQAKEQGTQRSCLWSLSTESTEPWACLEVPDLDLRFGVFDPTGRRLALAGTLGGKPTAHVWDLQSDHETEVLKLRSPSAFFNGCTFDPSGRWLTASMVNRTAFWPMPQQSVVIMRGAGNVVGFTSDGKSVVTIPTMEDREKSIRMRSLAEGGVERTIDYDPQSLYFSGAVFDPQGEILVTARYWDHTAELVPLDGSAVKVVHEFDETSPPVSVAYDPDRRLVASATAMGPRDSKVIIVHSVDSGSTRVLGPAEDAGDGFDGVIWSLAFLPGGDLVSCGNAGMRRWNLENTSSEKYYDGRCGWLKPLPDGRRVVFGGEKQGSRGVNILDLESRELRQRQGLDVDTSTLALSTDGELMATGHDSGVVLVGRVSGGAPYRLYGHESAIFNVAFSPDGSMIASSDEDGVVRIRPVPDLSKPPLGGLPLAELLAKLDTHTNFRMVRDKESRTGWTQEIGPFQGWAEVPEW